MQKFHWGAELPDELPDEGEHVPEIAKLLWSLWVSVSPRVEWRRSLGRGVVKGRLLSLEDVL